MIAAAAGDITQTLHDVIGRLGPALVTVAVAPQGSLDQTLSGVAIHDPRRGPPPGPGEVLLAVGVDPVDGGVEGFVSEVANRGYAAMVLHLDDTLPEAVAAAARRHGVVLLTARSDVPWAHLATMFRVAIISMPHEEVAGIPIGDLFGFANSLAVKLRGAVTIEDPQSRVLAYSGVKDEVDEPRRETILGRRVPERYLRILQERGVLRHLLTTDDVVRMEPVPEVQLNGRVVSECLYMALTGLDPTGRGRSRWVIRWKAALNAFDVAFEGQLTATQN